MNVKFDKVSFDAMYIVRDMQMNALSRLQV